MKAPVLQTKEKDGITEKNLKQVTQELNIINIKIEHKKEILKLCNKFIFLMELRIKTKMKFNFELKIK